MLNNLHNIGRQGLALVLLPDGQVTNGAGNRLYLKLVTFIDLIRLIADHYRQTDIDAVAVENAGVELGNDNGDAAALQGDGGGLAAGTGAEVLSGYDAVTRLHLLGKIGVGALHGVGRDPGVIQFHILSRGDQIRIDVVSELMNFALDHTRTPY